MNLLKPVLTGLMPGAVKKPGLPPGSLVFTGIRKTEQTIIKIIDYDDQNLHEEETTKPGDLLPFMEKSTVTWIDIEGLHDIEMIREIGDHFKIHPLVLEDVLNVNQRPKAEIGENYIYIVLKMLSFNKKTNKIEAEQVSIITGENYVITFQEKEEDVFDPIRERIRTSKGRIRTMGADYLCYSLLDIITDHYFLMLEKIGEQMEDFEEELMQGPRKETLKQLYILKRENMLLRKSVWPLREVITQLERSESKLIRRKTIPYLRDLYDHTIQVIDTVETYRDLVAGLLELYLSSVNNRMNEVMKVLTIIATIFIPLTFVAGVYGMNFHYMPELEWPWAYFAVLFIMILTAAGMLLYFRRKRWI
jgi:magnesium transporter